MTYQATVVQVMIGSPGDVAEERAAAAELIHEWNAVHSADRSTVLVPTSWEINTWPEMGAEAQAIINKQMLDNADLLVAIFWTRLGTPTESAPSGTAEEIEKHLAAGKQAMLYFSFRPAALETVDQEQWAALQAFRDKMMVRGLVQRYESIQEFKDKFRRQLAQKIIRHFPSPTHGGAAVAAPPPAPARAVPPVAAPKSDLSPKAQALLKAAANDPNGVVLATHTFGGFSVQAGGQKFADGVRGRDEAEWRAVLDELRRRHLVEQRDRDGFVYAVTNSGYLEAEGLPPAAQG